MTALYNACIECESNSRHLQQLYLGFARLQQAGLLKARWRYRRNRGNTLAALRVVLDDGTRLAYDCTDAGRLLESLRDDSDFYFKRSLRYQDFSPDSGLYPLGLNYLVNREPPDLRLLARAVLLSQSRGSRARRIAGSVGLDRLLRLPALQHVRLQDLQRKPVRPRPRSETRITFFAGLWDPAAAKSEALSDERHAINRTRIAYVQALKDHLGANFVGGVIPDSFSIRECGPELLAVSRSTRKGSYLSGLTNCDIGVATTGLQGSVGWKLGEYVALSMGVLAEPSQVLLPGDFREERNFLQFEDPDGCVEQADRLLEDPDLRWNMSVDNHRYYLDSVLPEQMVLNTLVIVGSGHLADRASQAVPADLTAGAASRMGKA